MLIYNSQHTHSITPQKTSFFNTRLQVLIKKKDIVYRISNSCLKFCSPTYMNTTGSICTVSPNSDTIHLDTSIDTWQFNIRFQSLSKEADLYHFTLRYADKIIEVNYLLIYIPNASQQKWLAPSQPFPTLSTFDHGSTVEIQGHTTNFWSNRTFV
jgi:hypothetical protein